MPSVSSSRSWTMPAADHRPRPEPFDYDTDPGRFRITSLAARRFGLAEDVHVDVADRFAKEQVDLALDVGCGQGKLLSLLQNLGVPAVGLDASPTMLKDAPGSRIFGDARALPFPPNTFGGAAAMYMLYHLEDPVQAVAECHRVLRPGGLFAACAPSRYDSPELRSVLPGYGVPSTFDSENAPEIIGSVFDEIEIDAWDGPYVHLPDSEALTLYLRGRRLSPTAADRASDAIDTPLTLTKRGAIIYARKPA
ncbi:MAG: class I SAM-dependent methyltransferase [Dehalococcoidia bacterium]|nr:class I SAM-dependent methyltransferase [Dehalococcoidia bacterium]